MCYWDAMSFAHNYYRNSQFMLILITNEIGGVSKQAKPHQTQHIELSGPNFTFTDHRFYFAGKPTTTSYAYYNYFPILFQWIIARESCWDGSDLH